MIASFKTHWKSGLPTYFIPKIYQSLLENYSKIKILYSFHHCRKLYNQGFGEDYFITGSLESKFTAKHHTIRAGSRWKAGMKIHFGINPRSKNYFQFAPVILVKSVQEIEIRRYKYSSFKIFVDGKELSLIQRNQIALNDGFTNVYDIRDFFVPKEGDIFKGQIIHWTDLKY